MAKANVEIRAKVASQVVIDPSQMYSKEAVRALGFSRDSLMRAKLSGKVTPILLGARHFFDGAELVGYLRDLKDGLIPSLEDLIEQSLAKGQS